MTAEEKEQHLLAKARVTDELRLAQLGRYRLRDTDARIAEYVREVAGNPDRHNLYELLAVARFLRMVDKYGLCRAEVQRFFTLYEGLHFPGKQGMTKYRLTPVQAFQFAAIYGFWEGSRRVVREACLYVPRKYSKTTSSAAFAIYDLLFGDANAESYTGANSQDQAKKCFDVIRGCMRRLDPTERRYTVNEQMIKSRRKDRSAIAQCLTANARTKDGLNASTVIMDEFSQARDANLLNVLTTSMGVRENPLTVIITTASDVFTGPFYSMLQGYKALLRGEHEDDSVFAHIFEPDPDDDEGQPATWRKVHPHMGVTVSEAFYRREYASAKRNGAEALLAFRTKLLNVYAENERASWIGASVARRAMRPVDLAALPSRPDAMCAIDLSERDDFSAITAAYYDPSAKGYVFTTRYFFPEGALEGHPNEALYRGWAAAGWLVLTPGEVIDYPTVVAHVGQLARPLRITAIGYDSWKSQTVVNMLEASGGAGIMRPIKQTPGTYTAAVESFEHGLRTGRVVLEDHPITAWCFGNAVLYKDTLENCMPVKRTPNGKIDGVMTILMCQRLFIDSVRQVPIG